MCAAWDRSLPTSAGSGEDHFLSAFQSREQAFELQFAFDEDLKFRTRVRRNKLFGLWAAEKLGLTGEAANQYAHNLVISNLRTAGDAALAKRVLDDFEARGVAVRDGEVPATMGALMAVAAAQVREEIL